MKKLFLFVFPIFLISCFGDSDKVKDAKTKLGINTGEVIDNPQDLTNSGNLLNTQTSIEDIQAGSGGVLEPKKSYCDVDYLLGNYLELNKIKSIENVKNKVDLTGKVKNSEIDKIVVNFKNETSSFPNDNYTLQKFEKGDSTFLYRAYTSYEVLDYGLNEYTIEAYKGTELVSKIKLEIYITGM